MTSTSQALPITKTEETVSHHQNSNVKAVGTSPARKQLVKSAVSSVGTE